MDLPVSSNSFNSFCHVVSLHTLSCSWSYDSFEGQNKLKVTLPLWKPTSFLPLTSRVVSTSCQAVLTASGNWASRKPRSIFSLWCKSFVRNATRNVFASSSLPLPRRTPNLLAVSTPFLVTVAFGSKCNVSCAVAFSESVTKQIKCQTIVNYMCV